MKLPWIGQLDACRYFDGAVVCDEGDYPLCHHVEGAGSAT